MQKGYGFIYFYSIEVVLSKFKSSICRTLINLIIIFRITIKTRIVLQRLLNYNPVYDQPMYAQHHSAQPLNKDDEKYDDDDLLQRQKLLAKEPEIPEKYVYSIFIDNLYIYI